MRGETIMALLQYEMELAFIRSDENISSRQTRFIQVFDAEIKGVKDGEQYMLG